MVAGLGLLGAVSCDAAISGVKNRRTGWERVWRWILALIFLPLAIGVGWAVLDVVGLIGDAVEFWVPVVAGVGIWLVIFGSLPRPMWLYVVGHELTHALWSLLFGGRIKSIKASSRGGQVVVTRSNALVILAPYFFPLYAALWVVIFQVVSAWVGGRQPIFWFHLGVGVTYAFHITLTIWILRVRQPDIEGQGWVFSAVTVSLTHGLLLLHALPWISGRVTISTAWSCVLSRTGRVLQMLGGWVG
jgi:hypothetical protein